MTRKTTRLTHVGESRTRKGKIEAYSQINHASHMLQQATTRTDRHPSPTGNRSVAMQVCAHAISRVIIQSICAFNEFFMLLATKHIRWFQQNSIICRISLSLLVWKAPFQECEKGRMWVEHHKDPGIKTHIIAN